MRFSILSVDDHYLPHEYAGYGIDSQSKRFRFDENLAVVELHARVASTDEEARAVAAEAFVRHVMLRQNFGLLPGEDVQRSMRLIAERVAPAVQDRVRTAHERRTS